MLPAPSDSSPKPVAEIVELTPQAFLKFRWLLFLDPFSSSFHCGD
jgi:hypothetical protein